MASSYVTSQSGPPSQVHPYPAANGHGGGSVGGAAATASGGNGGAPVPDSYFTETRKGEVNELKNLLRNFPNENPERKREIMKKCIAYMTLGIDVSRLFSEMMMAIETRDLVIKKMVYLYLTNYAKTHPELAQMCTNTLQKDCGNEDPMVRGLALRALCGLNLPQMVEYIADPVRRSLTDGHAYVRKTAVMGALKLYHLDKETFESSGFVDIMYDMLRDPDASVVTNCIIALNEVMAQSPVGGMAINRAIMLHLLNRIHEFNEFAKVQVLELVPRYIPANDEEGFQIMNLLDPVLRTAGTGAVLATIRAFLSLAEQLGDGTGILTRQIVDRVKAPLVTQLSAGSAEIMYTLLTHVETLATIAPGVFDDEYRQFYIRYNEPTYVRYLKMKILPLLANPDTAPDIVSELAECVWDRNPVLSRWAVRSMTRIACTNQGGPGAAESISRRLVEMLDLNVDHISSEAATALTLVIRKHPSLKDLIAPPLVRSVKFIRENAGRASIIYLLGECGDVIKEAPYTMEKLVDSYDDLKDTKIKLVLLAAVVKLFFLRPPEVQHMLGRLLAKATEDVSSQDLHDRALLYYRLLQTGRGDPTKLASIIRTNSVIANGISFAEEDDDQVRQELMEEFNTLSTIYGKTSKNFIMQPFQVKYKKMPEEHPLDSNVCDAASVVTTGKNTNTIPESMPSNNMPTSSVGAAVTALAGEVDLLGFDGPSSPLASTAFFPEHNGGISLTMSVALSGEEYQAKWEAINDADAIVSTVILRQLPASTDDIEKALASKLIQTMASGELPSEFKFFLYAVDAIDTNHVFLIQSNIEKSHEPIMIITMKGVTQPQADHFTELMSAAFH